MEKFVVNQEPISGLAFHKLAKWSICDRYPQRFQGNLIEPDDLVFLNLEFFLPFMRELYAHPPKNKFRLITHNSDKSFTLEHLRIASPFITKVYAINCIIYGNDLVQTIPIGFRDHPVHTSSILKTIAHCTKKDILIYMNFVIQTNIKKRTECYNSFIEKPWVTTEQNLDLPTFYVQLAHSKYVISPDGDGIDCHRVYESLYLNSIPIVKKNDMYEFYKGLPVLIIDNWTDVTEYFLIENYKELYANLQEWKVKNPHWLTPEFWLDSPKN